ncbi:uncharacterized protein LOC113561729 [Ooceraea biroi]|uniref:uncharacterized protein LOC113561729 n=1 Tax=Ooceraea biroi TaxID=2015173 RepID=UPI0005BDD7E2|nr:uncharacterized protein LOC113561729 [Ooceraea biroi]
MATKLAIRHKDSLVLKENKLLRNCETRKQSKLKQYEHLSLPWLILGIFLAYWLILCPLTWAACYVSTLTTHWPSYWPSFFWTVAFLTWIIITCGLMIFWRYLQVKQNDEINVISKYGSDNVAERPTSTHQMTVSIEDAKSPETKRTNDISDRIDRENLRRKDLPPLLIHKRMSGEEIEDTGVVHVEKENETAELNVASDYVEKSPLQNYLKLVTVSPSEDEIKMPMSPKTPMSPRELFFIDLIREAEKAENAHSLKTKGRFFPSEAMEKDTTRNVQDRKNERDAEAEDKEDVNNERNEETNNGEESKQESCYFIADVDSRVCEKTQVFLQIEPSVSEQVDLIVEIPSNESNEANFQEASRADWITEDNE